MSQTPTYLGKSIRACREADGALAFPLATSKHTVNRPRHLGGHQRLNICSSRKIPLLVFVVVGAVVRCRSTPDIRERTQCWGSLSLRQGEAPHDRDQVPNSLCTFGQGNHCFCNNQFIKYYLALAQQRIRIQARCAIFKRRMKFSSRFTQPAPLASRFAVDAPSHAFYRPSAPFTPSLFRRAYKPRPGDAESSSLLSSLLLSSILLSMMFPSCIRGSCFCSVSAPSYPRRGTISMFALRTFHVQREERNIRFP